LPMSNGLQSTAGLQVMDTALNLLLPNLHKGVNTVR
jgi:hypothetical protein